MSKSCSAAFGKWNDVNEGITHLESQFPEKKIIIVGASMGAQFTIDYLSTEEANRPSIGNILGNYTDRFSLQRINISNPFIKLLIALKD